MKSLQIEVSLLAFAAMAAIMPSVAAQTVVQGTGNPDVDVPAVQTAVDRGGEIILRGHFSFNRPPTVQTALASAGYPPATVLISKAVTVSGAQNKDDERASIEGGTIPFYVEAPGASVSIQTLRFIRPVASAILVYAAHGLTIANCKIEGVVPTGLGPGPFTSLAIYIATSGNVPTPAQPGYPVNIFGRLLITNNEIDVIGGTAADNTLGITVFSVGQSPDKEADIYVSANKISNTTEPAINFRLIGGRAHVEGNVVNTGPVSSQVSPGSEAIRVVNTGSYVIAHNIIHCEWPDPTAKGIGVFSQFAAWPMEHAVVMDNFVTMSPPPGTTFGDLSAGIGIRGFTGDNVVANNKIRGRAKAALSVDPFKGGIPDNNTFMLNHLDHFEASSADMFIGEGVIDTLLLEQKGTDEDHGMNTVIEPVGGDDGLGDRAAEDHKER
jgi:hypothetical protein